MHPNYYLTLDLVLDAIGVQLDVYRVLICKPGVPSLTENCTLAPVGMVSSSSPELESSD